MASIVFLHGASSSGKSTLASALRKRTDRPFLHLSIDHLRDSGAWDPSSYLDWRAERSKFFAGFHSAVAAFADAGNDTILEHILDTAGWHAELQSLFQEHDVLFVGLFTGVAELCAREQARGDREIGSAVKDQRSIHQNIQYDIELDGAASPDENADQVLQLLASSRPRSAFFT